MKRYVQIAPSDTVVVCLEEILPKDEIQREDTVIQATQTIPMYHKMAICRMPKGAPVYKYGEIIGRATQEIAPGDWVHVHNMESLRGRGDKKEEKRL